jgi:hypothetical protein
MVFKLSRPPRSTGATSTVRAWSVRTGGEFENGVLVERPE